MSLSKNYDFESERLRFRGIEKHDAEDIVRWRSDPANYQYFFNARPVTLEEHLAWFERYQDDITRYDFIIEDANGKPIGTCGLSAITEEGCEISYMIGEKSVRGKGYATETVRALSSVVFSELGVSHVDARILPHNAASVKIVEKCGYREAELVYRLERDQAR